ncbi:MAG: 2-hydroxy-acid oxidase, partial [Candidatus Bathyarchaeota archaeon B23]
EGNSETEVEWQMEIVGDVCLEHGAIDAYVADTEARMRELWEARKCLFDAYKAFWEIDEVDVCVPRSRLPDYVEGAEGIGERYGMLTVNVGHAGDGNIHTIITRPPEMEREAWLKRLEIVVDDLIHLGLSLDGTVSGEHGLGYTKRRYLVERVGPLQVELMRAIKRAFDPRNILNPGKILP